jgi:Cupin
MPPPPSSSPTPLITNYGWTTRSWILHPHRSLDATVWSVKRFLWVLRKASRRSWATSQAGRYRGGGRRAGRGDTRRVVAGWRGVARVEPLGFAVLPGDGIGFQVVLQGNCWFLPLSGSPVALAPGDVVVLPHGHEGRRPDQPTGDRRRTARPSGRPDAGPDPGRRPRQNHPALRCLPDGQLPSGGWPISLPVVRVSGTSPVVVAVDNLS